MVTHRTARSAVGKAGPGLIFTGLGLFAFLFMIAIFVFMVFLAGAFILSAVLGEE